RAARPRRAHRRVPAGAGARMDRRRAGGRAAAGGAVEAGQRTAPVVSPDPVLPRAQPAGGPGCDAPGAAGTGAPRFRCQRIARAAYATDRAARLPGDARTGSHAAAGAGVERPARTIAPHDADRRGPADAVAARGAAAGPGRARVDA